MPEGKARLVLALRPMSCRRRVCVSVWILGMAVAGGLAGCGRTTPVADGTRRGILQVANPNELADLDPATNVDPDEDRVLSALYEGLVRTNADGSGVLPAVAERWALSPDGLTYTFFLRPSAKWSNGEPVTAQDFVYSFRRLFDPGLGCEQASWGYAIVGARDCVEGRGKASEVGVRAADEHTFEIRLIHPSAGFLAILARPSPFVPVYAPLVERLGGGHARGAGWTRPGVLVSNGPFRLKAWETDRVLSVVRNPDYWDAGRIALSEIDFHPVDDPVTREHGFRAGQYHLVTAVDQIPTGGMTDPCLKVTGGNTAHFLTFNVAVAPYADPRVRRALSLAIDRDKLVEATYGPLAAPAYTYAKPGFGGYGKTPAKLYDPAEAKHLLAEAGYPGGRGFPVVSLMLVGSSTTVVHLGEVLQEDWRTALGVRTELAPTETKVYLDAERTKHFTVILDNWSPPWPDPTSVYQTVETGNPNNDSGWSNARCDALVHDADVSSDRESRARDFEGIEALIASEVPYAPLYHRNTVMFVVPSVHGLSLAYPDFRDVSLQ